MMFFHLFILDFNVLCNVLKLSVTNEVERNSRLCYWSAKSAYVFICSLETNIPRYENEFVIYYRLVKEILTNWSFFYCYGRGLAHILTSDCRNALCQKKKKSTEGFANWRNILIFTLLGHQFYCSRLLQYHSKNMFSLTCSHFRSIYMSF